MLLLFGLGRRRDAKTWDRRLPILSDDVLPDAAVDVGEAKVAAAVLEGELFVVNTHEVEHGGPELVDIGNFFDGVVAELVGGSKDVASLGSTAGHPEAEALWVVVAADVFGKTRLGEGVASKLPGKDDEGFIK